MQAHHADDFGAVANRHIDHVELRHGFEQFPPAGADAPEQIGVEAGHHVVATLRGQCNSVFAAFLASPKTRLRPKASRSKKVFFPWTASGRATANGRDEGVTKLLFDDSPEAHGHGRAWGAAAGQCGPTHARTCSATQAVEGALPVGSIDRQNLRSVPAAVPDVRWADAPDRLCHRGHTDQEDPRPHRGRLRAPAHSPGTRATAMGRRW